MPVRPAVMVRTGRRRIVMVGPRVPVPGRRWQGRSPRPPVRGRRVTPVARRRRRWRAIAAPGVVVEVDEQPAKVGTHVDVVSRLGRPGLAGHGRHQERDKRAPCQCSCCHDRSPCALSCVRSVCSPRTRSRSPFAWCRPGCRSASPGVIGEVAGACLLPAARFFVLACSRRGGDADGPCRPFAPTVGGFSDPVSGHRAIFHPTWGHVGSMSGPRLPGIATLFLRPRLPRPVPG